MTPSETDRLKRSNPSLPRLASILYGLGAVASGVKDGGFRSLLLFYCNEVLGMSPASAPLAILVALVFDAANDPVIEDLSDRRASIYRA
jgi:Na+/melibiose symporter-like transporter